MSILITGMKMPTGDRPVHIEIHRDGTVIQWKFGESDEIIGTAVDVPTPHGRLIDTDAVSLEDGPYEYDEWCKWALIQYQDAPTIIEAEE